MSAPGLLAVSLADPAALAGTVSLEVAESGILIGAGQSYEAALHEVKAHFRLNETGYTCAFSQRIASRGRTFIIAPSAWERLAPETDLELVVFSAPAKAGVSDCGTYAAHVGPVSPPVALVEPHLASQQSLSQAASSGVAPATPSNTDDSSDEISDSDVEVGPARSQRLDQPSPAPRPEQIHEAMPQSTSTFRSRTSTPNRSGSPSPSNRSSDFKAFLRQQIQQDEAAPAEATSHQSTSYQRYEQQRSPSPPSQMLDPAVLRYSVDSHASFRIGLDDGGNVAFVPPSPAQRSATIAHNASQAVAGSSHSGKGKQRARSQSPQDADDEVDVAFQIKSEPQSSQDGALQSRALPVSPRTALKPRSSGLVDASFSTALSRDSSESHVTAGTTSSAYPRTSSGSTDDSASGSGPSTSLRRTSLARSASERILPDLDATPSGLKRTAALSASNASPQKRPRMSQHMQPNVSALSPSASSVHTPAPKKRSRPRPSAAPKDDAQRRLEALARPRVPIPAEPRSGRFTYWIRLPNWPISPVNEKSMLRHQYLYKQGARGDVTLGLTLQFVVETAAKLTGWKEQDLRLTFYSTGADGEQVKTIVWGWDRTLVEFCDLEEIGLQQNGAIDLDMIEFDSLRPFDALE
ncbi:hypothetical protein Rhopal_002713-T1 [Rhodotorula paludigena]|uniref:Proteophosphoglycan ppg4 n=1 Tax=Rhodotorula paludigena TaxID=86838 RepID=A0AAV5GIR3_9BASI|nr:hypothetical protein Rhopal_002713-T1 [Rhodotorula paludigena]